jgi:hypothetical protein
MTDDFDDELSSFIDDPFPEIAVPRDPAMDNLEFYSRDRYMNEESPSYENTIRLRYDEIPEFAKDIVKTGTVSVQGTMDFLKKFLMIYMMSDYVRKHTDGWTYLFIDEEYVGSFASESDAMREWRKRGGVYSIFSMYPPMFSERTQVTVVNSSI